MWPGSTVKLPSLVLTDSESSEAAVLREGLLAALDAAGCEHDVCAVFSLPGRDDHVPHRDRHHLDVMHERVDLAGPTP